MLGGTIAMLGTSYVLTLAAQNCVDGSTLAEQQVQAAQQGRGHHQRSGRRHRRCARRSANRWRRCKRYDANIEQATTKSLDALKAYSQGMTARRTQGDFDSVPFFRRAVDLDPEFALAHARLGTVLSNLGERAEAEKAATRAYELRDKVSERERLYIEARYFTTVARDQPKAIESYRLLLATYPDDFAGALEHRIALSRSQHDEGSDRAPRGSGAPRAGSADRPRSTSASRIWPRIGFPTRGGNSKRC